MKVLIAIGFICTAVLATYSLGNKNSAKYNNLDKICMLAFADDGEVGKNVDDEADANIKENCEDGSNCECNGCKTGTTDCSPTCSCCPGE